MEVFFYIINFMNIKKLIDQAEVHKKLGEIDLALKIFEKILRKIPTNEIALINLSIINLQTGNLKKAEQFLEKAYKLNITNKNIIINLILTKIQLNKFEQAEALLEEKKEDIPEQIYYENKIRILRQKPDVDINELEKIINSAYLKFPDHLKIINFKGMHENVVKNYENALKIFKKGYDLNPELFETNYNVGITLNNLGRWPEAENYFKKAIKINPQNTSSLLALGASYRKQKKFDSAINIMNEAIKIDPINCHCYYNMALLHEDFSLHEEAIKLHKKAIEIDPNYYLSHMGLSDIYLKQKKWVVGFEHWKWRLHKIDSIVNLGIQVDDFQIKEINFDKKINLVAEMGIGDEIFLLRQLSLIDIKNHKNLNVYIDKRIMPIYQFNFKDINFYEKSKFKSINDEQSINLGSLPRFLIKDDGDIKKIKNVKPTENSEKKVVNIVKKLNQNKIKCGIAWKSKHEVWGKRKSIDLSTFENVFNDNYQLVNLQYGECDNELRSFRIKQEIINPEVDLYNDLENLFSLISNLDLVVTTSNITAHISGSLGKKTFLLLPKSFGRIWYWNYDDESIWYPSIKMITQDYEGNWDNVMSKLKSIL